MEVLNRMKMKTALAIAVLLLAACLAEAWQMHLAEVAAMQKSGIAELYAMVDSDLYRDAEKSEIKRIRKETKAAIREADEQNEIDTLLNAADTQFSVLKSDAFYTHQEEEAARLAERERKRQEELERIRREEEARRAAEAAAAAARARQKSSSSSRRSSGSNGCVGTSSDNFW